MIFFGSQRPRRLVENDNLRVVMNGTGNLDHLLLTRAETGYHGSGIDREIERLQELLAGDVDAPEAIERLGVA